MNANIQIEQAVTAIQAQIDRLPVGAKINRAAVRVQVLEKIKEQSNLKPAEIDHLLSIVLNLRSDIRVSRGKAGGSFKTNPGVNTKESLISDANKMLEGRGEFETSD